MLQGLLLGVLGWRAYRALLFPCLYLYLMVPTGAFLLRPLQEISHAGSVLLVQLSGIPVFAEGMLIQVPSGNFIVEPGCAGLNFLLASFALSLLYAKLTYRSLAARTACVAIALTASIIANIVRIYLIIAITEWTDRRIDIADDHLLYGWGFFGVIMLLMMWIGTRFGRGAAASETPPVRSAVSAPPARRLAVVAAGVVAVAAAPAAFARLSTAADSAEPAHIALPTAFGDWTARAGASPWQPDFVPGDASAAISYSRGTDRVDVAVIAYRAQRDGREAAAAGNRPSNGRWEELSRDTTDAVIDGQKVHATRSVLRAGHRTRVVLAWYVSADCMTASRLIAKMCAARLRITGRAAPGAFVAMSAEAEDPASATRTILDAAQRLDLTAALAPDVRATAVSSGPGAS
jgi:EpsI family protein